MTISRLILSTLILFLLFSCDSNRVYDVNQEIENGVWNREDPRAFNFEIVDTNQYYNLMVNVRNKNDYPYSNLYLFIDITSPSNKFIKDTLEIKMADKTGKWKGSGIGNIWQNQIALLREIKMTEKGVYKVTIEQGMRVSDLKGISDIGVRVETTE